MKLKNTLLVLFFLSLATLCAADGYIVVVNKSNPVQDLSYRSLVMIFLGEKTTWEDDEKIKLAVLKGGEVHKAFLKDTVKMSPLKFSHYWKRLIFTGSGAWKVLKNEAKLKEYIKNNPEAIGYLSSKSIDESIKKLRIKK